MKPLVSIITPTFNSEKFISETIKSVQNQTYENWEMIIVDDFSSDKTTDIVILALNADKRIKLFKLEKNSGAGVARNTALEKASGKYIAFLDADDLWKPQKLEKQIKFMISKDLFFTFSFYECIDEEGNRLNKLVEAPNKLTYRQLFYCNYVGNLTGIYDADYFGKIQISSIRKRQDWMMWLTVLKKIRIAYPVPESLAIYRIRDNSISASKWNLIQHNFKVYKSYHKNSFFVASVYMVGFLFTQLIIKPSYIKKIKALI
ncbi:MAG: glycosyltransferase family 2 protein [Flavobacterium sp.]|nr:MAG: glycosyltransferase family 2 protein [Flavobacterium sp.]